MIKEKDNSRGCIVIHTTRKKQRKILRLKLRGGKTRKKRVRWENNVIDNENLNRKKSKKCCIYHKSRNWDESDSESD